MARIEDNVLTLEEVAIKKLRKRILDIISDDEKFDDDCYLFMWLKANLLDPEDTERMIRKSVQWRKEMNVESVDEEIYHEFKQSYEATWSTARDGRLDVPLKLMRNLVQNLEKSILGRARLFKYLSYSLLGNLDFKKGIATYGKKLWTQLWSKLFMEIENKIITYNKTRNLSTKMLTKHCPLGYVDIENVKNFSASQLWSVDVVRSGHDNIKNVTTYFPAMVELSLMINVNKFFKVIFNVVKPFLDKPHFKYEIFGSDEAEWKDRLLEIWDEETFQKFL